MIGKGIAVVGASAVVLLLGASPAMADGTREGGSTATQDGGALTATVNVTTDAPVPGVSSTYTVSVPPACYWEPFSSTQLDAVDDSDAKAVKKYVQEELLPYMNGHAAAGYWAIPAVDEFDRIIRANKGGAEYSWYSLDCKPDADPVELGYAESSGHTYGDAYSGGAGDMADTEIAISMRAFEPGAVPPPLIDPKLMGEDLWAQISQDLAEPEIERNPTISASDDATLVNLPTWFWVANGDAALAGDGQFTATATVAELPQVWVRIKGSAGDLVLDHPEGTRSCGHERAQMAYVQGGDNVADSQACTVSFTRADPGADVTASITWSADWETSTGESGTYNPVTRSSTVVVPITESQAVVTDVD